MPSSSKKKKSTYQLSTWVAKFAAADVQARPEMAAKWLAHMLDDMGTYGTLIPNVLFRQIQPYMLQVREMVWAIPSGHAVYSLPQSWLETETNWLRQYLDPKHQVMSYLGKPLDQKVGILRDMWLQPDIAQRRNALLEMAKHERPSNHHVEEPLIRLAAWDVALESGMDDAAVMAATKITLATYSAYYNAHTGSRHPLMGAINLILARAENGKDTFPQQMATADAKELLTANPMVCATMLHWVDDCKQFSTKFLHGFSTSGGTRSEAEVTDLKLDSLATWLPQHESAIRLAQQLGFSYREVLDQVIDDFGTEGVECSLPTLAAVDSLP